MDWHLALRIFLIVFVGSALSGLVAFLGNKLGRNVGRRKMSLFGLRPKYTSNLITVATGSLIFMLTLGLGAAFSWEVRQFLEGFDELEKQRTALEQKISRLNDMIKAGPGVMPFEPLALGVVECGLSKDEEREQIDLLLQLGNDLLLRRNNELASKYDLPLLPEGRKLVGYVTADKEAIIDDLSAQPKGSTVVCAILAGEKVVYYGETTVAQFLFKPNPIVFHKDEVIVSGTIDGRKKPAQVYDQIVEFIYKDVPFTCLQLKNMMRNPFTNKLDTTIGIEEMRKATLQISRAKRPMKLEVVANSDIRPLGPLEARLVVTAVGE